jgi:hypothetical protein
MAEDCPCQPQPPYCVLAAAGPGGQGGKTCSDPETPCPAPPQLSLLPPDCEKPCDCGCG